MRKIFFLLLMCCYTLGINAQTGGSYWNLTGNGSTSPGTHFIGTTDAQRLVIKTSNTEQATVLTNGNVGIATTSPEQKLDINGVAQLRRIADATAGTTLQNSNTLQFQSAYWNGASSVNSNWKLTSEQTSTTGFGSELVIKQDDGITRFMMGYSGFNFYERNSGFIMGYNMGTDRLNISKSLWTNSINNAGTINTIALGGLSWYQTEIRIDNPSITYKSIGSNMVVANTSAHKFTVLSPLTEANTSIATFDNGGSALVAINKDGKLSIGLSSSANDKLDVNGNIYISNPGKLLIGTTASAAGAHRLAVDGSAIFTKAVVKLIGNWPDYVFAPSYKLKPLNELEAYILKNQHLPDVPPATEVQKNGIDLGDNQTILLKKVEELTLYMIELNKKVEAINKENEQLKKQVNSNNK